MTAWKNKSRCRVKKRGFMEMGRFLFRDYSVGKTNIKGLKEETCIDRCIYKEKKLLKRERKVKK